MYHLTRSPISRLQVKNVVLIEIWEKQNGTGRFKIEHSKNVNIAALIVPNKSVWAAIHSMSNMSYDLINGLSLSFSDIKSEFGDIVHTVFKFSG